MRRALAFLLTVSVFGVAEQLNIFVQDPEQRAVAGCRVTLRQGDSVKVVRFTRADGSASIELPAAAYQLEVVAPGFAVHKSDITVPSKPVDVVLSLAPRSDSVQVTATQSEIAGVDSGTVPYTLDGRMLELMQPAAFSEAIRFAPGAIVNTQGRRGGLASLFVRGGESRHNKVIVDGVTVNDVGGTFDLGVVPVQEFDRFEFVRGAESALYGTDAMTSTLQTFSRTGSTRVPELRFGADGGTFASGHGYASLAGAYRDLDYNLFGDQFNSEGQGLNDEYSNSSQGGNFGYAISKNIAARLRVRHSNNRSGVQSFWLYEGRPPLPQERFQYARQNNLLAAFDLNAVFGRWQHRLSAQEYNHRRLNRDPEPDRGCSFPLFDCGFEDLFTLNRAAFDYRGEFTPRSWGRVLFGYRYENQNGFVNQDFGGFIVNSHGLRRNHELFGEGILTRGRASLILGGRYVRNESFGDKVVPRVAASFRLLDEMGPFTGTVLRFAYGRGFKEPRLEESFGAVGQFGIVTLPNPDLRPEENRSIETGITQNIARKVSFSATYFNNGFTKLIIFNTDPITFESQYINLGRTMAHGAEVELHARITERVSFDANYTHTSSQVLESTATNPIFAPGAPLLRRPKHAGQILVNYVGRKWGGNLGGIFIGRRPDSDFFVLSMPITSVAGYARFDVGGWHAINKHVTAYVNVENLLNKRYQEVAGYPALKANFRAGLRFLIGGE